MQQGAALFADHIATGHYNETRSSDKRKKCAVLLDNKKFLNAAMEAASRDIMQARSSHTSTDVDFVIVRGKNKPAAVGASLPAATHLVVSSTEYTAKGEIDIHFRRQSDASKSIGDAELEQLAKFLYFLYVKIQTQKKSNGIFSCWARSLRTRDAFPEVEDL
ncbi:hypothetical protein PybrP1_000594 [[Pythium] brassicae (nom. inval.)]|nr:hypothetical protein PybrP1_000594 [[Pythium] brassicae (nom. inval.)]